MVNPIIDYLQSQTKRLKLKLFLSAKSETKIRNYVRHIFKIIIMKINNLPYDNLSLNFQYILNKFNLYENI